MSTTAPSLVWFRNDLRLTDNAALSAAATTGPVVALYILDDTLGPRPMGAASLWWLDKSLRALAEALENVGSRLILRRGPAEAVLRAVVEETGARAVHWNRLYDSASIARDRHIKQGLIADGVTCRSHNSGLLNEPWAVHTGAGGPYKVFTPYWRAARALAEGATPLPMTDRLTTPGRWPRSEAIEDWALHPRGPDWSLGFDQWRPGEAGARARLADFLAGPAGRYGNDRNSPAVAGTSGLSPHLHFGEIGPREVWATSQYAVTAGKAASEPVEAFLRELGWREFNHHLLFHFPQMEREGFNPRFADFAWRTDPGGVEAWRRGLTGYPIVDAGMRQLWATGWMHNRVRMIAASFLVKDLLVDWRIGEAWFWDTLVDADLANNVAGWQWVAGSGADAAPYFRVFNPVLQGQKFDPEGLYIRRWLPELAALPNCFIQHPWRADPRTLRETGIRLGVTYPAPIVDHGEARERALAAYERVR